MAQAAKQDKKPELAVVERKATPADMLRFKGREFVVNDYAYTAHPNTQPEDLLAPEYWAHVATQLRVRDRIEVWADDASWIAEYTVLEAGRNYAKLHMLWTQPLSSPMDMAEAQSPYEIVFRGPHAKWSVVRRSDKAVVHDGEEQRDGAAHWVRERLKAE